MPQLKLVENAGSIQYSKNINNFGEQTLTNTNLKFTLCDLTDYSVRPFGNLFTSFNLPITQTQKDSFKKLSGELSLDSSAMNCSNNFMCFIFFMLYYYISI